RYDEETERRMIFDAALVVLRRNDYQDVSVADILTEAGISTRSFYRHFASKDQPVCALFRRDAERAAQRLVARVHDAPTPLAGLEAWIDEILGFSFEVGKARRVAVLGTPGAMRADGYAEEAAHASQLMLAPLLEVLEAGRADGSFPSADPLR